ncbi:MAG: GFA family protein [Pseudomonadota bacterium]
MTAGADHAVQKEHQDPAPRITGQCLCGSVRFTLTPPLRDVIVCHCTQCAQWTGHAVAATQVDTAGLTIDDPNAELRWYRSSDVAERGFCQRCGSSLFWRRDGTERVSVMAGAIDDPSGLKIGQTIFADDRRDYLTADPATPITT